MKKVVSVFCILFLLLNLCACASKNEEYISGAINEPAENVAELSFARYENPLLGIILEYPETFERVGNFNVDNHISFEEAGTEIYIYNPDSEADLMMTAEEYAINSLDLPNDEEAGMVTYGKTLGYRTYSRIGGRMRVDFVAKGLTSFYHFAFVCPESLFSEDDPVFSAVMSSIRIEDGKYTLLNKMLAEYTLLLDYVTTMQYITDANYASHCLNLYETSNDEAHLNTAINSFKTIKTNLDKIHTFVPGEDESFRDLWEKISFSAEKMSGFCSLAISAIHAGNLDEVRRISRSEFPYDLSNNAQLFLDAIATEISEY